jgi:hypothetical protein
VIGYVKYVPCSIVHESVHGNNYYAYRSRLDEDQWVWVFRTATVLSLAKIRQIAVCEINELPMSPARKAALGHDYRVRNLAEKGLHELIQRDMPLDVDEGMMLGIEWTVKLAQLREEWAMLKLSPEGRESAWKSVKDTHFGLGGLEWVF